MPVLYLTEQGTTLRTEGGRLWVERDGSEIFAVPCVPVEAVMVFGHVQVTTQALTLLLAQGAPIAYLSRRGRLKGQVVPPTTKNIPLRLKQYERACDEAWSLKLSRVIVRAKIANQGAVLRRLARNHRERADNDCADELKRRARQVASCDNIAQLMGIEGIAARRYFGAWRCVLPSTLHFGGRGRHAPDAVNALLNLGYSLAGTEIAATLEATGFDPHLGFLHRPRHGRVSLALDALEEFRAPLVDRLVLGLLNRRCIGPHDFELAGDRGWRLRPDALKTFLRAYDRALNAPCAAASSFRRRFAAQSRSLGHSVRGDDNYAAFRYA